MFWSPWSFNNACSHIRNIVAPGTDVLAWHVLFGLVMLYDVNSPSYVNNSGEKGRTRPITWMSQLGPANIWNLVSDADLNFLLRVTSRGLLLRKSPLHILSKSSSDGQWLRTWDLHCLLFTFLATNTHNMNALFHLFGMKLHSTEKSDEIRTRVHIPLKRSNQNGPFTFWKLIYIENFLSRDCWANRQHQKSGLSKSLAADEHTHESETGSLSDATPPPMTVKNKIKYPK